MNNSIGTPTKKPSLWKTGRKEYIRFVKIKLGRRLDLGGLFIGILLTAIFTLPIAIFIFQFVQLYWFIPAVKGLFLAVAWAILMICNGISSYINVKYVKAHCPNNKEVTSVDEKAVFFYQTFNIGFGFVTLILIIVLYASTL